MQHLLLTFLLLIFTGMTTAQNRTVTGVISDPDGPIGGAIITVKGTERYSTTNFDGFYSIMVNDGDVLVFSYVGYESQEVKVGLLNIINVILISSSEEIVIECGLYRTNQKISLFKLINNELIGVSYQDYYQFIPKVNFGMSLGSDFENGLFINGFISTYIKTSSRTDPYYQFIDLDSKLFRNESLQFNYHSLTLGFPKNSSIFKNHSLYIRLPYVDYSNNLNNFKEVGVGVGLAGELFLGIGHYTNYDYFKSTNIFSTQFSRSIKIGEEYFTASINYQHLERFEEFTIGLGYHF